MKRVIVGTVLGGALFLGGLTPIDTYGPGYGSIFKMNDGSYAVRQTPESQYIQMGGVNGYQFNPTIAGGTWLTSAKVSPEEGTSTVRVIAWDGGKQITVKDAGGKDSLPQFQSASVVSVPLAGVVLGKVQTYLKTKTAHAAIAADSSAKGVRVNAQSITYSCTFTGSNLIALIEVGENNTVSEDISSATINGVGATKIDRTQLPSGGQGNMWFGYLFGPTTGNCVGNISGGVNHVLDSMEVSYTGVIQSGTFNVNPLSVLSAYQNATTTTNASIFTQTTTPCADNSWLVWVMQNDTATPLAGVNFTIRQSDAGGAIAIGDNNAAITPPAATSMSTTNAVPINWQGIQVSIAPVGATCSASGPSSFTDTTSFFQVLNQ